jgi:hypothetical protein
MIVEERHFLCPCQVVALQDMAGPGEPRIAVKFYAEYHRTINKQLDTLVMAYPVSLAPIV